MYDRNDLKKMVNQLEHRCIPQSTRPLLRSNRDFDRDLVLTLRFVELRLTPHRAKSESALNCSENGHNLPPLSVRFSGATVIRRIIRVCLLIYTTGRTTQRDKPPRPS